jgi:NAD(P)-dependent dehydrogenase (short-subunit alcohol dehydrogenase family)
MSATTTASTIQHEPELLGQTVVVIGGSAGIGFETARRARGTYTFTRRPDGLTDIDVVVVRDGKNLKGRLLGLVVGTIGKGVLKKAFENSVKALEARNSAARDRGAA